MRATPILELRLGEPRWYSASISCLVLAVIAALLLTPLMLPYVFLVFGFASLVVWQDIKARRQRARFSDMLVYPDFSIVLIDSGGSENSVERIAHIWVTSVLCVLAVHLSSGSVVRLIIGRSRNSPDAYRRFCVICRFAFAVADSERHNVPQSNTSGA